MPIDTTRIEAHLGSRPAVLVPPLKAKPPLLTARVTTHAELSRAIADAKAGTTILCAPGTYAGPLFLSFQGKSGTPENPIRIVAEKPGETIFEGNAGDVVASQPWTEVRGVRFRKCRFVVRADHVAAYGNWFESHFGVYINCTAGARNHYAIAYNSFTGWRSGHDDVNRASQIYFQLPDTGTALPEHGRVFRNWFMVPKDGRNQAEQHHFYIGNTYNPSARKKGVVDDLVLFHNLIGEPGKPSDHRRGFYWKWGGEMIENASYMTRGSSGIRHGVGARLVGNIFMGNEDVVLNGADHQVIGNRWKAAEPFAAMCEHLRFGKNKYQAANAAAFAANDGDLAVGYYLAKSSKIVRKVSGVVVDGHAGKLIRMQETGTQIVARDAMKAAPIWRPVEISKADVGPWALFGPGVRDCFPPELMDPEFLNDADEPEGDWTIKAPPDFDPDVPESTTAG